MRLRELRLLAYGPFAGETLTLGGSTGGVDVVFGPNEAGKSTTLRAIFGFLFGIPENTQDAHRHARADLRVGALVESARGERLSAVRRKGRKATLLAEDGKALPEDALGPFLGGVSAELFNAMFGLDHVTLRASGRALLEGKGSVGESLFSAGIGARGIHAVRERLRAEADSLFTPRGRDQKAIVKAIAELRDAKRRVDEASVTARAALAQEQALREAVRERDLLRERRVQLSAERAAIERLLEISPHLAEREHVVERLERLGDVVFLGKDAAEQRKAAVRARDDARQKRRRIEEEVARVEARLAEIVVPEGLLELEASVVRDVEARLGRHAGAEIDLPKRKSELAVLEEAVTSTLAAIDPSLTRASVERLRVGATRASRIRRAADDRRALGAEKTRLRREADARDAERAAIVSRLLATLPPGSTLTAADLAAPKRLVVPAPEASALHGEAMAALSAERTALARDAERASARLRDVRRDREALALHGDVPTEESLRAARADRDARWSTLRSGLEAGTRVAEPTPAEFERAIAVADETADRLRREADRVAALASLTAECRSLEGELAELAARRAEVEARERQTIAAFRDRWAEARVVPGSAVEAKAWSERFLSLLETDVRRGELARQLDRIEEELARWQEDWAESMSLLGLPARATAEEAVTLLDATRELFGQVDRADGIRRRIEGMRRDSLAFEEEMRRLAEARFPEARGLPVAEGAALLLRNWEAARRDRDEQARLVKEREGLRTSLRALVAAERDAEERVAALLAAGKVSDLDALEAAERRSEEARVLSGDRERVEQRLTELGDGASVEELARRARDFDPNRARARLAELEGEIERLSEELEHAVSRIATIEGGAQRFEQSRAADAAEDLAECVAKLRGQTERYVRVKLASAVLDREIERYRQANQGPIVDRASALFPRLTVGRYVGLRVGYGESDDAVLRAIRPDGADVGVEALSDGTRDQLYLALRLASLEHHARSNEPMPLVLDDVLIHFDDERSRAAIEVLGDVSRTTQVLFFTHHARLVELAREALGEAGVRVHRLGAV
ncbi:MAG TPA: AAA family ATPase [Polyangiaceae bacterium]|nr:AAA family ATPase [Polyangiaceae bacterium]